jgi:cell division protein FtsN
MKAPGGSSRLDSVLKLLLVAFISLLAFSSGVYFGKNMSDTEHQVKALESPSKATADSTEAAKNLDVKPEDALVDEEVAEISDKYVNGKEESAESDVIVEDGAGAKTEAPKVAAKTEVKAEPKTDSSEVQKVAQRVARNEQPEEKAEATSTEAAQVKKQKRQPASLPKTVGYDPATQFTVQIASYPTEEEAKVRSSEMVKKGFPAYPVEANIKGKTWYRVSVGSFKTKQEAADYRTQLMKQANVTAAIVQPVVATSSKED